MTLIFGYGFAPWILLPRLAWAMGWRLDKSVLFSISDFVVLEFQLVLTVVCLMHLLLCYGGPAYSYWEEC
jgi:hypothetical protein